MRWLAESLVQTVNKPGWRSTFTQQAVKYCACASSRHRGPPSG